MDNGEKYLFGFFIGVLLGFALWAIVVFIASFVYCYKNGIPMFG